MPEETPEVKELIVSLNNKKPLVAMLAPSFPIIFEFPQIIGKLKRLGFKDVVEVSLGAREVNQQLSKLLKNDSGSRYITNPCPSIVRLIKNKHPELKKFLSPVDTPMSATAKIIRDKFPGFRPVFIGPCYAKKLEAKEDFPDLNILVLTFNELIKIFEVRKIIDDILDKNAQFDLQCEATRLYPLPGGLSQSSGFNNFLTDEEYDTISGPKQIEKSLTEFPYSRLRVLDILFCEGGCLMGSGIKSILTLDKRREKIIKYWQEI